MVHLDFRRFHARMKWQKKGDMLCHLTKLPVSADTKKTKGLNDDTWKPATNIYGAWPIQGGCQSEQLSLPVCVVAFQLLSKLGGHGGHLLRVGWAGPQLMASSTGEMLINHGIIIESVVPTLTQPLLPVRAPGFQALSPAW